MVPANKKYSSKWIDGKHNPSLIDGKHDLSLIDGKHNLSLIDGKHNPSSIDGKHNLSLIDGKHNQSLVDRIHSVQIGQEPPNHKRGPETPPFEENVSPSSKEIKPVTNFKSSDNVKTHANKVSFIDIKTKSKLRLPSIKCSNIFRTDNIIYKPSTSG